MRQLIVTATLAIVALSAVEAASFADTSTRRSAADSVGVVLAGPTSSELECWSGNSGRPHCNS